GIAQRRRDAVEGCALGGGEAGAARRRERNGAGQCVWCAQGEDDELHKGTASEYISLSPRSTTRRVEAHNTRGLRLQDPDDGIVEVARRVNEVMGPTIDPHRL